MLRGRREAGVLRRAAGWVAAALVLVVALTWSAQASAAKRDPFSGDGSWIWYVSSAAHSPQALARKAKRAGLDTLYVKSSDGTDPWSQFTEELVDALHARGLRACAWSFVYGAHPKAEARASAQAAERGADCLVIDAESDYEGRYREAYDYVRALRRRVGDDFPLGLSSFPYVDFHPSFPYSVFLAPGAATANLPQVYWKAIGDPVRGSLDHTYRFNQPYGRAIYPVGQTWQDPSRKELTRFRRRARDLGAKGVSWWSWHETSGRERRTLKRRLRGRKRAKVASTGLERGDRGDLVLRAQELLGAWELPTPLDGRFRRKTEESVAAFQEEQGLEVSGRVDNATWRVLIKREPEATNWRKRRPPKALVAAAAGGREAAAIASARSDRAARRARTTAP